MDYRILENISHVGLCMGNTYGNTMGAYTRYIINIFIFTCSSCLWHRRVGKSYDLLLFKVYIIMHTFSMC